jgi:hypothetical protein
MNTVVTDSVNWVRVSGSFIADSAYTHIGIGNYFSDSATTIIPGTALSNYAYYLIDDVCVSDEMTTCGFLTSDHAIFEEKKLILFPNPASENITVQFNQKVSGTLRVIDNFGKAIVERQISAEKGDKIVLDIPATSTGIYNVIINDLTIRFQQINN